MMTFFVLSVFLLLMSWLLSYRPTGAGVKSLKHLRLFKELYRDGLIRRNRLNRMLFRAVKSGDLALVRSWEGAGADVNAMSYSGFTVLHGAAVVGHLDMVEFLVGRGADVNATDDKGWKAQDWAAVVGYLGSVSGG